MTVAPVSSATTARNLSFNQRRTVIAMGKRGDRSESQRMQQRAVLAQEAARLISERGIQDYRLAKSKAAHAFGMSDRGALPSNREIEAALEERNRIFSAAQHAELLESLRSAAVTVMEQLQVFRPRLVGSVLSGTVTEHSAIHLHVFSDAAEAVGQRLATAGIAHQLTQRRHRLRHDKFAEFPGFEFWAADCAGEATVFPERRAGHPPLSPVDGRPMQRAGLRDVQLLLAASQEPLRAG